MINVVNYVHFYIDLHLYSIYILEEQPPVESEPFSEMLCDGARTWGILCGLATINTYVSAHAASATFWLKTKDNITGKAH